MRGLLWIVVMAAACGKVTKLPDATTATDAAEPDGLGCAAPALACGDRCFDVMTDHEHCGACDLACVAADDCIAGHCTDATASCAAVKQFTPDAPSGVFTHKLDGATFFCDVSTGLQYDELAYGEYDVPPPAGYTMIGLADFQTPTLQQAFIYLFNKQGGARLLAAWTAGNCCFKYDGGAGELFFGGNYLEPMSTTGTIQCDIATDALEAIMMFNAGVTMQTPVTAPIPADFFTTNPPGSVQECSESMNPAFFWKRH